ncbi:MAG: sugar phosphate nucleotidyltransferase [Candidatus Kryptonium sp.]|nr:sugar phosphate nucleotidyltransferase [Candidatus Kryptonium sp.]MDW8109768.1 sugar phosphate nucleotidyltransferase [Candidatus Kryptonium sp.]
MAEIFSNYKHPRNLATVILAAGKGTRMKNPDMSKVMFYLNGEPMIKNVVNLAFKINSDRVIVVVGYNKEMVMDYLKRIAPSVEFAIQEEQLGTGHAVMQTEEMLKNFDGDVLVLSGDVPLLTVKTMRRLLKHHYESNAVATLLTAEVDDPTGYGRIIRNPDGSVDRIVEHKDATEEERKIKEINSGIYVFKREPLFEALKHITPHNVQGEYYLTDVFYYFSHHDMKICALKAENWDEIHGINTMEQLEKAREILERRRQLGIEE